jgi:hypothetical protein
MPFGIAAHALYAACAHRPARPLAPELAAGLVLVLPAVQRGAAYLVRRFTPVA